MNSRRWTAGFMDAIHLLGVAVSVPIAILLVGAPIALSIAFVLWLARSVRGGL